MYYVRFFYDVTCFIIINIIFMNIIFGIIIDTFAELRNKKNSDAKLMSKSCTICSVENTEVKFPPLKTQFERRSNFTYDHHVTYEHNVWSYYYFMYYLVKKENSELSSLEAMVNKYITEQKTGWMPDRISKSMKLELETIDEGERVQSVIGKLKSIVESIGG